MKYYIIAGEASGDLHGSNLMKEILLLDTDADFRTWGGDKMAGLGGVQVKHYRDLAFMGFTEVLLNLRTILRNLAYCKNDIVEFQPDVVVLIDYPGFNLRIAEYCHQRSIKVVYYISPQVWAWKAKRVHKIRRFADRILCILPFEEEFYQSYGYKIDFVGHPLIDAIDKRPEINRLQRLHDLGLSDKPVIALLPGSRKQEIATMLPVMIKAAEKFSDYQIAIAGAPSQDADFYEKFTGTTQAILVNNRTYDLLEVSDAAMVTSGTATLETALFKVPQVVCYKGGAVSYIIARQLIKIKYISLVNLIADREVVKELIQKEFNVSSLGSELKKCLQQEGRERMLRDYEDIKIKLGGSGASANAARIILEEVRK